MTRTLTETIVGYAHCGDPRCPGYSQQEVAAEKEVVEHTYADGGGDMPGVEKSHVYFRFSDAEDIACPDCGRDREVTDQKRLVYQPLSGHSQNGLLEYKPRELA